MANLNRVTLIGRLGADPELKAVGSSHVVEFSIATTETWKDKEGNKQERTEWSNIFFWGGVAEIIAKYFHKGSQILVEGSLQTEQWEKDGQKHYTTKIKGRDFGFIDAKGDSVPSGSQPPEFGDEPF